MKTIMTFRLVSIAAVSVLTLDAQQAERSASPMLSPIPIVNAVSVIPEESTQYVYLGPKATELTISYPSELETGRAGPRRTATVKMLNQVRPIVSTTVAEQEDGTFEYSYSVQNSPAALDEIKVLALALPATDALLSSASGLWSAKSEPAPGHENPLPGAMSMTPVILSTWRDSKRPGIAPGNVITVIKIRSAYRPGLTVLYARSNEDYDIGWNLPTVVKEQLNVMRALEWQNQSILVIGPVYPKSLPRDFVANEFSYGMARLIRSGQLTESSPAVVALKKALESAGRSASGEGFADQLRAVPQTGSESELINAAVLSLR